MSLALPRSIGAALTAGLLALAVNWPSAAAGQETSTDAVIKPDRPSLRERWKNRHAKDTAPAKIDGPGDYTFTMEHGGATRMYRVHVPVNYSSSRPTPMVLSFHGGGGNMEYQADDKYYGLITKSENAGFIAVFPNGSSRLRSGKLATWNAGICCGRARDENVDDVGFVREIVVQLKTRLNIDPNRIFANGMSNGGMMSYRLACEMADTFRAIAAVAGTDGTKQCSPSRPVSILHIHARDDDRVLFNGGAGKESQQMADFVSVPDTVAKWVRQNGCNATPTRVLDRPGATCDAYRDCRDGTEVRLCVTDSGGHSWPGGVKVRTGEPGSTAINATDVIWDFYSTR
jgi:polyhydroxybutyrate depolymerase